MVTGWKDTCFSFFTKRRFAGVFAFAGGRRSATPHKIVDGSGFGEVVAGWEDNCVYFFGVSRLQGRRLQQQARRGKRQEQGEGTRRGAPSLQALDPLE